MGVADSFLLMNHAKKPRKIYTSTSKDLKVILSLEDLNVDELKTNKQDQVAETFKKRES